MPYRQFAQDPMLLAKETLTEVPVQLLNYFRTKGIKPNPATEAQKIALQRQLSKKNSLGGSVNPYSDPLDEYLMRKK